MFLVVFSGVWNPGFQAPALLGKHPQSNKTIMEEFLVLVLLLGIYWNSVMRNNETFDDIPLRNVTDRLVRWFLILRRSRVFIAQMLLIVCSVRFVFDLVVEPVVNLIMRIIECDIRLDFVLASTDELLLVSIICIVLTVTNEIEHVMLKKIERRYGEECEESEDGENSERG